MVKKKLSKSGSKVYREPPPLQASSEQDEYHAPAHLLGLILDVWRRAQHDRGSSSPARRLAVTTAGIITGAKLFIRLNSRNGELEMRLKPTVEQSTEQASDELAESLREQMIELGAISREMLQLLPSVVLGEKGPKEVPTTKPSTESTNWRWIHPAFDPNVDTAAELISLLSPFRFVFVIANEMVELLLEQRRQVTNRHLEMISGTIAAIAAAKWCLSLWGNHKQAATVEHLAEGGSEALYNDIQQQLATRAATRH